MDPICYDKNGNPVRVGDVVTDDDGNTWTVNGFLNVPKSGVYTYYSNRITLNPKITPPTPLSSESDTIIWGS